MSSTPEAWAADMQAIHREAAGVMELWPILYGDMPELLILAAGGHVTARLIVAALGHALRQIDKLPTTEPALCGCCARPLDMGGMAFIVAVPRGAALPGRALAMGICGGCGRDRDSVREAGIRAMREAWPDSRPIVVTHAEGGRA